jgi:hypothetical protein
MENDQDKSLDNLNIQTSSQSLDFAAYVIGGSILLGAIVISATVFYFAHKAEPFLQQLSRWWNMRITNVRSAKSFFPT